MHGLIHVLLFVPCVYGFSKFGPLVYTKQGLIRGLLSENGQYSMYLGIPYAFVDEWNPFGPSTPYPAFDNLFEAIDDSLVCPQMQNNAPVGTLDCLRLSVYVPSTATSQDRLPVMMLIHSGAFVEGSGNRSEFGPDFLVRHNIIMVTFNYRLGPYGFLCLDNPIISGNQGLKDQIIALKWVRDNIESFGGDPNKVTIFGESSGAKSIHLHLLSDKEKLYDKVIIQSGVMVTPLRLAKPDSTITLNIAKKLGFSTHYVEDALIFLTRQNPHHVVQAAQDLGLMSNVEFIQPETKPCIENNYEGAFITDYPFNLRSYKARNMPIMFGFNSQESLFKLGNADAKLLNAYSFKDRLTSGLDLIDDEMADLVRHFYIGDAKVGMSIKEQMLDFESDFAYYHPTERTMKRYIKDGATVYFYAFYYEGKRNYLKQFYNVSGKGASHGDELGYLFKSDYLSDKPNPKDQQMIDIMTTMWTNFAKYGDPTPKITKLLPVKWLPVNGTAQNYLKIDSRLSLLTRPFQERMAFWDLFYKLNGESQICTENKLTEC